nr:protein MB21D2-like [Crassostrea gigas]
MTVQFLAERAYHGMCHEIGTPEEVSYRREILDIREFLDNRLRRRSQSKTMNSGSIKEGFRLKESDRDIMMIIPRHRVIWDMSHSELYNTQEQTLILCNTSESPLGFALLWLPLENTSDLVYSACVRINGGLYISSAKFREYKCSCATPNSTIHGPCRSTYIGKEMYDIAHCFVSDFWPPAASSWINRCPSWPPQHVTDEIVSNGCHFVAIGHKVGNHADIEWRISFSQAENKLIYSMNHTQFLTYGLLKLFLNEVINAGLSDEEKLLCSYHMKTAIFWAIQQNMLPQWCPENILAGFWICFKLILKWVYEGVCPNFFIPQK